MRRIRRNATAISYPFRIVLLSSHTDSLSNILHKKYQTSRKFIYLFSDTPPAIEPTLEEPVSVMGTKSEDNRSMCFISDACIGSPVYGACRKEFQIADLICCVVRAESHIRRLRYESAGRSAWSVGSENGRVVVDQRSQAMGGEPML